MTVLLTGAAGFVGLNLVKKLAQSGVRVLGLYRAPFEEFVPWFLGDAWVSNNVEFLEGDITSKHTLTELSHYRLSGIIHAAVITPSPADERADPTRIAEVNFGGTLSLLQLAVGMGVDRFLYVSSSGVYGNTGDDVTPVHEARPVQPYGLYGITKVASEGIVNRFGEMYELSTVSARIGAPYGPGERPTGSRTIMSPILEMTSAAIGRRGLTLKNAHIARDWTHISDTCDGLLALYDTRPLAQHVYNVSRGRSWTLEQVGDVLVDICPDARFSIAEEGEDGDTGMSIANRRGPLSIEALTAETGFSPSIDIAAGLQDYARWFKKYRQWLKR